MGKNILAVLVIVAFGWYLYHRETPIPPTQYVSSASSTSQSPETQYEQDMKQLALTDHPVKDAPYTPKYPLTAAQAAAATTSLLGGGGSSSSEQAILSGNAVFTGGASDGAGSSGVTSTYTGGAVPTGYHLVKGYYTKKGTYVKAHLVRNRTSTSKSSSAVNYSNYSQSYQMQDRMNYSHQTFPGQTISSDPTVIIGKVNIK